MIIHHSRNIRVLPQLADQQRDHRVEHEVVVVGLFVGIVRLGVAPSLLWLIILILCKLRCQLNRTKL